MISLATKGIICVKGTVPSALAAGPETVVLVEDPKECVVRRGEPVSDIKVQRDTAGIRIVKLRHKNGSPIDIGTATAMRLLVGLNLDDPPSAEIDKDIFGDQNVPDLNVGKVTLILTAGDMAFPAIAGINTNREYFWQITVTDAGSTQRYPFVAGKFVVEGIVEP